MTASSSPRAVSLDAPRLIGAQPLVALSGVTKRYGRITAVDDVSLSVYEGEVLGIVGESGSGKSTVMRLLNLEETADAGAYTFDTPVQHIGIVYQNPHLGLRMNTTSSGNVAERLLMTGERSFDALREAARNALAASEFPLARMDDLPRKLSGGMQQRVQLAKAIALKPRLLLLDEPTTGLDVSIQATVLDTLKRLQRTTRLTTVLVSHDLGVIRTLADRVIVMRHGRVVESGLTDQVLEDPQDAYTQQLVFSKL
jgi:putative phosphonate transport system ATP-binding protein